MDRETVMLKLLALGPLMADELVEITGWGRRETLETATAMVQAGQLRTRYVINQHGLEYMVPEHAAPVRTYTERPPAPVHIAITRTATGLVHRKAW